MGKTVWDLLRGEGGGLSGYIPGLGEGEGGGGWGGWTRRQCCNWGSCGGGGGGLEGDKRFLFQKIFGSLR